MACPANYLRRLILYTLASEKNFILFQTFDHQHHLILARYNHAHLTSSLAQLLQSERLDEPLAFSPPLLALPASTKILYP